MRVLLVPSPLRSSLTFACKHLPLPIPSLQPTPPPPPGAAAFSWTPASPDLHVRFGLCPCSFWTALLLFELVFQNSLSPQEDFSLTRFPLVPDGCRLLTLPPRPARLNFLQPVSFILTLHPCLLPFLIMQPVLFTLLRSSNDSASRLSQESPASSFSPFYALVSLETCSSLQLLPNDKNLLVTLPDNYLACVADRAVFQIFLRSPLPSVCLRAPPVHWEPNEYLSRNT